MFSGKKAAQGGKTLFFVLEPKAKALRLLRAEKNEETGKILILGFDIIQMESGSEAEMTKLLAEAKKNHGASRGVLLAPIEESAWIQRDDPNLSQKDLADALRWQFGDEAKALDMSSAAVAGKKVLRDEGFGLKKASVWGVATGKENLLRWLRAMEANKIECEFVGLMPFAMALWPDNQQENDRAQCLVWRGADGDWIFFSQKRELVFSKKLEWQKDQLETEQGVSKAVLDIQRNCDYFDRRISASPLGGVLFAGAEAQKLADAAKTQQLNTQVSELDLTQCQTLQWSVEAQGAWEKISQAGLGLVGATTWIDSQENRIAALNLKKNWLAEEREVMQAAKWLAIGVLLAVAANGAFVVGGKWKESELSMKNEELGKQAQVMLDRAQTAGQSAAEAKTNMDTALKVGIDDTQKVLRALEALEAKKAAGGFAPSVKNSEEILNKIAELGRTPGVWLTRVRVGAQESGSLVSVEGRALSKEAAVRWLKEASVQGLFLATQLSEAKIETRDGAVHFMVSQVPEERQEGRK